MRSHRAFVAVAFLGCVAFVPGCVSTPARRPVPEDLVGKASLPGISANARIWGDVKPPIYEVWMAESREEIAKQFPALVGTEHHYLAISGGGSNGAFGAGLLVGWTASGTRPEFALVTGISTGALIAPFAFLGPDYDGVLREVYTRYSTDDLVEQRNLLATLTGESAMSTTPLANLIARYVDEKVLEAIAAEHRRGRRLFIGTTDLDAGRPVIWNLGEIAQSGGPAALDLARKVLLASASIPVAFPPVMIEVEAEGKRYDEMHVDGGATSQVTFYPMQIDWRRILEKLDVPDAPTLYLIRNAHVDPAYGAAERRIASIGARTIASLIRTQGIGDLYRIFLETRRDGIEFRLADIPDDFTEKPAELFDPVYMKKLFDLGHRLALEGFPWKTAPPGMSEK